MDEAQDNIICTKQSGIIICYDTLRLDLPGHLTTGAMYDDNYFLFFQDMPWNPNPDRLYRVSIDGSKIIEVDYPKEFEYSIGCDVMIRNDSLIIFTQWGNETYHLNSETLKWTKVNYSPPVIYEDSEFKVSHICNGEYGGIVSFLDKKNGLYYDVISACAITVNKLNNKFYITNFIGGMVESSSILEIKDPRSLYLRNESPENNWFKYYSKLNSHSKSNQGAISLFDNFDLFLSTSFVYNKELLHIYLKDSSCFVGILKNQNLSEQLKIDIYPSYQHKLENNNQFLKFRTKSYNHHNENINFGLMEILEGELNLHYIVRNKH